MIVDLILDRKDGYPYKAKEFYNDVFNYGEIGFDITRAMDGGTEEDVKKALCNYIIDNKYNPSICDYINKVYWLRNDFFTLKDLKEIYNDLYDTYENFIIDDNIEALVTSNDVARDEMIMEFKMFIESAEFYLNHLKQLDKELKL